MMRFERLGGRSASSRTLHTSREGCGTAVNLFAASNGLACDSFAAAAIHGPPANLLPLSLLAATRHWQAAFGNLRRRKTHDRPPNPPARHGPRGGTSKPSCEGGRSEQRPYGGNPRAKAKMPRCPSFLTVKRPRRYIRRKACTSKATKQKPPT